MVRIFTCLACVLYLSAGLRPEAADEDLAVEAKAKGHMQLSHKHKHVKHRSNRTADPNADTPGGGDKAVGGPDSDVEQAPADMNDPVSNGKAPDPFLAGPSKRTDLCQAMKDVNTGKTQIMDGLKGQKLKLVTKKGANTWVYQNGENWHGYDVAFLKELQQRGKFEFEIINEEDHKSCGDDECEQSWTELAVNKYDMSLSHKTMTAWSENQRITTAFNFLDSSLVLVTDKKQDVGAEKISIMVLTKPFTGVCWAVFALITLFTGVCYWYVERMFKDKNRSTEEIDWDDREEDKKDMWHGIYFTIMQCHTSASLNPVTLPGRIIAVCWAVFTIVWCAAYTANLASCLLELKEGGGWQDLQDVMEDGATICVSHSRGRKFMQENYPNYMDKTVVLDTGKWPIHSMVVDKKCDAALAWNVNYQAAAVKKKLNPNCDLHRVGDILETSWGGWGLLEDTTEKCTQLIQQVMRALYMDMFEDGTTTQLFESKLLKAESTIPKACGAEETSSDEIALPFAAMAGLFALHLCGVVIAVVYYMAVGAKALHRDPMAPPSPRPANG